MRDRKVRYTSTTCNSPTKSPNLRCSHKSRLHVSAPKVTLTPCSTSQPYVPHHVAATLPNHIPRNTPGDTLGNTFHPHPQSSTATNTPRHSPTPSQFQPHPRSNTTSKYQELILRLPTLRLEVRTPIAKANEGKSNETGFIFCSIWKQPLKVSFLTNSPRTWACHDSRRQVVMVMDRWSFS